jgi:hypothetical protein
MPLIFDELIELRKSLSNCDLEKARRFIKQTMANDVIKLQDGFHEFFKDVPSDDLFKLEVLQTLAELGIKIY